MYLEFSFRTQQCFNLWCSNPSPTSSFLSKRPCRPQPVTRSQDEHILLTVCDCHMASLFFFILQSQFAHGGHFVCPQSQYTKEILLLTTAQGANYCVLCPTIRDVIWVVLHSYRSCAIALVHAECR